MTIFDIGVFGILLTVVLGVKTAGRWKPFRRVFNILPEPFWCYFLPMLLATAGGLPAASPVYSWLTSYGLAACLVLLLVGVDMKSIVRLGPVALSTMGVGIAGVILGAVTGRVMCSRILPPEASMGVGALSASWTGGSANMLAVKEALKVSDSAFAPLILVDTAMTYGWMALMISLAPLQSRWDRWVGADETTLRYSVGPGPETHHVASLDLVRGSVVVVFGLGIAWICVLLAPSAAGALIAATTAGIVFSFTPLQNLERWGASRIGSFFLYVLLAAIGARAHLTDITRTPGYMAVALWLGLVHASLLIAWGRWRKIPMFFLVSASQANFGGTASAPIVAGIYRPVLASVGLLLAVFANMFGTYIGLFVAWLCRVSSPIN